jgi:hypothetical protein
VKGPAPQPIRLTTRGLGVLTLAAFLVALVLGFTAEWWDPFTQGVWVVSP